MSGDTVQGYGTTSAASASRIAVPITELPTSVIMINEQVIEDIVAISAAASEKLSEQASGTAQIGL